MNSPLITPAAHCRARIGAIWRFVAEVPVSEGARMTHKATDLT